jgi:hypothetical protein
MMKLPVLGVEIKTRTAVIAVALLAVLFAALVVYVKMLASGNVPSIIPTLPGRVSLQAYINDTKVLTYNNTRNIADYALVSYSLKNATSATVALTAYMKNPMPRIYLLNVSAYCLSCFSEDYLRSLLYGDLAGYGILKNGSSFTYVDVANASTIPRNSVVVIPSGILPRPLIIAPNSSVFRMLSRGDTVVFIGRNFSTRSIDLNLLVYLNPTSVTAQFLSLGIAEAPFPNTTNRSFIRANMSFKGSTFVFAGGRRYGNATFINSGNGTVIAFPNYPTAGWSNAQTMASDIASAINSRFWIASLGSGTSSFATKPNAGGNVGVVAIFSNVINSTTVGPLANSTYSLVSMTARGPSGAMAQEFSFPNRYAWNGIVGVQSVAGEKQSVPLIVSVNGNPKTNNSVLLHLDMYDKNMSYVGAIPLAFVLVGGQVVQYRSFAFPSGYYIMSLKDFNNNVYSDALFYLANVTLRPTSLDFKNGTFAFSAFSNGLPISNATYAININGAYGSLGTVMNGTFLYALPKGTIVSYGTEVFSIRMFNTNYTISEEYSQNILHIPAIYIEFAIAIILVVLLNLILRPPTRDEYYIDVPEFPPSKAEKVGVQASSVLSVFDKVNYYYRWTYMPLTVEEIRLGINSNIRANNMPVSVTSQNANIVLAELVMDGQLVSSQDYYAPKAWIDASKHSIDYLVIFRKLRDYCVSHAILFTDLDADKSADMLVTRIGRRSSIFISSPGEKMKKVSLSNESKSFVVFMNEGARQDFINELYTSLGKDAETLKLGIEYNYVRLVDCDHLDQIEL